MLNAIFCPLKRIQWQLIFPFTLKYMGFFVNIRTSFSLATALMLCAFPVAAEIEFYGDDKARGKPMGTLLDTESKKLNLKDTSGWANDKVRSLKLKSVTQGTRIRLFDSPEGSTGDDWVEITVKQSHRVVIIPTLELTTENKYYKQSFTHKNGLNGKVSRIEVYPATGNFTFQSKVMRNLALAWTDKDGAAHRFANSGKNYRFWKPDLSISAAKDVHASFKMDHIRGSALDEHMNIYVSFDQFGNMQSLGTLSTARGQADIESSMGRSTAIDAQCLAMKGIQRAECAIQKTIKGDHANAARSQTLALSKAIISAI